MAGEQAQPEPQGYFWVVGHRGQPQLYTVLKSAMYAAWVEQGSAVVYETQTVKMELNPWVWWITHDDQTQTFEVERIGRLDAVGHTAGEAGAPPPRLSKSGR